MLFSFHVFEHFFIGCFGAVFSCVAFRIGERRHASVSDDRFKSFGAFSDFLFICAPQISDCIVGKPKLMRDSGFCRVRLVFRDFLRLLGKFALAFCVFFFGFGELSGQLPNFLFQLFCCLLLLLRRKIALKLFSCGFFCPRNPFRDRSVELLLCFDDLEFCHLFFLSPLCPVVGKFIS